MKTAWSFCRFVSIPVCAWMWGGAVGWAADATEDAVTSLRNSQIFIHDMAPIEVEAVRDVAMIDWSARNNQLLFSKRGISQYYSVFSSTPEGFRLSPLTLDRTRGAMRLHESCASWHPTGRYFVFSGQNRGSTDGRRSGPDGGWHCNLWVGRSDGSQFWQLTDIPTRYADPRGATMPVFSPDGKKIFWTGFTGGAGRRTPYEKRALYIADFTLGNDVPRIEDEQMFQPGFRRDFYESYAFSPSGERILFSANMQEGQPWYCMDICHIDRNEPEPKILAPNIGGWDRYASYSPDGRKIVWTSSRTFDIPFLGQGGSGWQRYMRSELWIMDADGRAPKQLTFFNSNTAAEYTGRRTFVGDTVWGPDGNRLAVVVHRETRSFDVSSRIYMITLGKDRPRVRAEPAEEDTARPAETQPAPTPRRPGGVPTW